MKEQLKICLTFDVEEFDAPKVDYNVPIKLDKQLDISREATVSLIHLLTGLGVRATFFITGVFAEAFPGLVRDIAHAGHEIASHGYAHGSFRSGDYALSRDVLETISGQKVVGFRSPRMAGADLDELARAGYLYDSSLNPCFLPGKYNNLSQPRRKFVTQSGVCEIPSSVTPLLRLPLFWLSLHWIPVDTYGWLARRAARKDGYLNLYFHPWEFSLDLDNRDLRIPFYIRHNSGVKLTRRLARVVSSLKERGAEFVTLKEIVNL